MVHIHAEGPAFFCWIPKLFGKRVICTIHGLDWDREKWRGSVASKFIRGGEKNAVKYADEIIVLSKDVQKYFLETYGRETHFIPNGVNRPEVREAKLITDHFGLEKDSYILFLGRLVPKKGIRYLVEAFKNVKTDKKLVIAGGSSDTDSFMEELKELAKGDDRILFTGFVQGAMLDELYSNAYIYTLPSDLEGMPLSLLEAMSYGKGLDVGFAFDGDADRCLCVDEKGNVITGDHILYIYVMGGWGIWETVNGEQKLTTECIENVIMMVPFTSMVIWTFREKIGNGWKKILWQSGKIAFGFSLMIEMLQLLLRLGTFQLSDIFYNTVGGVLGGLMYYAVMKVRKRL